MDDRDIGQDKFAFFLFFGIDLRDGFFERVLYVLTDGGAVEVEKRAEAAEEKERQNAALDNRFFHVRDVFGSKI